MPKSRLVMLSGADTGSASPFGVKKKIDSRYRKFWASQLPFDSVVGLGELSAHVGGRINARRRRHKHRGAVVLLVIAELFIEFHVAET